jgi:EmrB/QacA subfamily drug resistance transporter
MTSRSKSGAFALLASVQFVLILGMTVLNVALPDIQQEFGLSRAELVLLSASYGMSFSGLLLLGGRLSDLYGARRVFVVSTALFAISSAAAGLAPGFGVLLSARFVQGVGAAFAVPAAMALVGLVYSEPARHARAMAVWGGLAAFGGTAGMLLSGVVAWWDSWRWAFVVPVAISVVAVALASRMLPQSETAPRERVDILGAILVTAGITVLGYGLVEAPERGWSSPLVLATLIGGVVLLGLFAWVETRVTRPLLPLAFLSSPRRAVALLAVFLGAAGITTIFFMLSLYFQEVLDYSPLKASAAFVPFGLALVATGLNVGRLVGRFGPRVVTLAGLLICAAGLGLLSLISTTTPYVGPLLAGLIVFPVGVGMVFAGATVSATSDVPAGQAGLAGAVVTTALEMGPAVGLAILVTVAAARTDGLTATGMAGASALTSGYGFALAIGAIAFLLAAAGFAVLRGPRAVGTEIPALQEEGAVHD